MWRQGEAESNFLDLRKTEGPFGQPALCARGLVLVAHLSESALEACDTWSAKHLWMMQLVVARRRCLLSVQVHGELCSGQVKQVGRLLRWSRWHLVEWHFCEHHVEVLCLQGKVLEIGRPHGEG